MEVLKYISIRGRVAYLLCLFENVLLHYNCNTEEWRWMLEKLWSYTTIKYLDDWMYELSEYMPNSVLEDTIDDAEYITESEYKDLYNLYSNSNQEILCFLQIIFECGTCELYSKIYDYSLNTSKKIKQANDIIKKNNINSVDIACFEKYLFSECDGWGICFENTHLSKLI